MSLLERPGSTRAVGLVRILLAFLVWSEFADALRLENALHGPFPHKLGLSMIVYVGSLAMAVGAGSRAASLATGLGLLFSWQWLGEAAGDDHFRRHHVYTLAISTTLLSLTPCGSSFSLDRWLAVREARAAGRPPPPETGDLWAVFLLQFQVAAMYWWAAYDKSYPTFGERMESYFADLYFGADHPGPWLTVVAAIFGFGTIAWEYVVPFGLWWPRTRGLALASGVIFHVVVYWLLAVATYTCTMLTLYLLFLDPRTIHRLVDDLVGKPPTDP